MKRTKEMKKEWIAELKKMQKGDYLLQNFAMFTNLGNTSKPFLKVNQ